MRKKTEKLLKLKRDNEEKTLRSGTVRELKDQELELKKDRLTQSLFQSQQKMFSVNERLKADMQRRAEDRKEKEESVYQKRLFMETIEQEHKERMLEKIRENSLKTEQIKK